MNDRRRIIVGKKLLSDAYQQVAYIESTGTQYIDTGIAPNGAQFGIEVKFNSNTSSPSAAQFICGSANTTSPTRWNGVGYSSTYQDFYVQYSKNNSSNTFRLSPTNDIVEMSYSIAETTITATMNGVAYADTCDDYSANSNNIYIFARNDNGSATLKSCIKLYAVKMTSNNQIVREFVPCYRKSDNEMGLYDIVNDVFYANAGTGTFLKGADVFVNNS